jgi:RimJ/RimL family protein N-acetyltransferase
VRHPGGSPSPVGRAQGHGRIQAETHPANVASQRVLEKAGFVREGVIRRSCFSRGAWRDPALYSLLREEWREPRVLPAGYR